MRRRQSILKDKRRHLDIVQAEAELTRRAHCKKGVVQQVCTFADRKGGIARFWSNA